MGRVLRDGMEMLNMCEKAKGGIPLSVTDIKAVRKWSKIPKYTQERLLSNVYCSGCGVTTIIDFSMHDDKFGIALKGKCKKCGKDVARLIEDE